MVYIYICKNPDVKLKKFSNLSSSMVFNSRDYSIFDHIKVIREKVRLYQFCKSKDEMSDLYIFTDSDFVVRELSTMINLGEVGINNIKSNSVLKEYDEYSVIKKEDVKAFGLDGSEIKVDHMGIHAKDFDVIIDEQNEMQGIVFEEYVFNINNKGS